jgi:cysteinyl-tRNA synthetase
MEQAQKSYNRLINTIKQVKEIAVLNKKTEASTHLMSLIEKAHSNIINALEDDFDTPTAIAEILTLFREINKIILQERKTVNQEFKERFFQFIDDLERLFGIFPDLESKTSQIAGIYPEEAEETIKALVELLQDTREELRKRKLFDLSDRIRNKLRELSIDIEDKKVG